MSQQINLYESRLRPNRSLLTGRNVGASAVVLLLAIACAAIWAHSSANKKTESALALQKAVAEEQERLLRVSKQVADQKVSPALSAELESAKAMLAARTEVIELLESGKIGNSKGFSAIMAGFARQSLADLWLTGFQFSANGDIEIRGRLLDPEKLPSYVQRLSTDSVFKGRRFAALEMRGVEAGELKLDGTTSAKSAEKASAADAPVSLPRYVEFVLRSDNTVDTDSAPQTGGRP